MNLLVFFSLAAITCGKPRGCLQSISETSLLETTNKRCCSDCIRNLHDLYKSALLFHLLISGWNLFFSPLNVDGQPSVGGLVEGQANLCGREGHFANHLQLRHRLAYLAQEVLHLTLIRLHEEREERVERRPAVYPRPEKEECKKLSWTWPSRSLTAGPAMIAKGITSLVPNLALHRAAVLRGQQPLLSEDLDPVVVAEWAVPGQSNDADGTGREV